MVCGDRMYEFFDVMMLCFFVSTNAPFIYYFWSYLKIEKNLNPVSYVVPTGNFGNVWKYVFHAGGRHDLKL